MSNNDRYNSVKKSYSYDNNTRTDTTNTNNNNGVYDHDDLNYGDHQDGNMYEVDIFRGTRYYYDIMVGNNNNYSDNYNDSNYDTTNNQHSKRSIVSPAATAIVTSNPYEEYYDYNEKYGPDDTADNNDNNNDDTSEQQQEQDQLPNIEEYKTTVTAAASIRKTSKDNCIHWCDRCMYHAKKYRKQLLLFVFGILLTVTTIIGFVSMLPKSASSSVLSIHPNEQQTQQQHYTKANRFIAILEMIDSLKWSDPITYSGTDGWRTPQELAIEWLSSIEDDNISSIPSNRSNNNTSHSYIDSLLQRYVLAVLYYSTTRSGDTTSSSHWNREYNFLNHTLDVCDWNEYVTTTLDNINTTTTTNNDNNDTTTYSEHLPEQVGVICQPGTSFIERIYIPNNNLNGTLPIELRLLTNLIEINFHNNSIHGTVPTEYAQLTNLQSIVLNSNHINDAIPQWISNITNLTIFDYGNNPNLYGTIPTEINQLHDTLQVFNCESCGTLHGSIDTAFQGMFNLRILQLNHNKLTGMLSSEVFSSLYSLEELYLGDNLLSGTLPYALLQHLTLSVIDLHGNQFSGTIASVEYYDDDVEVNTKLRVLELQNNRALTGSLTPWIYQLPQVEHINLSYNNFNGTIPTQIGTLTELKHLYIAMNGNIDSGTIPTEIGHLTKLRYLSFQKTNRVGTIPTEIQYLNELQLFDMNNNRLTGTIPFTMGMTLSNLQHLLLHNNLLSSTIPSSFVELRKLETFLINTNAAITGPMDTFCQSTSIRIFNADCTNFTDSQCSCCTTCCDNDDDTAIPSNNTNNDAKNHHNIAHAYCDGTTFFSGLDPTR